MRNEKEPGPENDDLWFGPTGKSLAAHNSDINFLIKDIISDIYEK